MNIKEVATGIKSLGGQLFIVGGFVRDRLMGLEPKDLDLLVVGLDQNDVVRFFTQFGSFEQVIGNAPVFMWVVDGEHVEVALARKEISVSEGKHGFEFVADATVTLKEDLGRRDFTINAMAQDVLTGEIIDPFNGHADIDSGMLRIVSEAFKESPERVLRLASFASRFGFYPDWTAIKTCRVMFDDFVLIPKEQIWRHFSKLLSGKHIGHALRTLRLVGWLEHFPQLNDLRFTPQSPEFHPEGTTFYHTCFTVDAMQDICGEMKGDERLTMLLSAICHDMGKPACTVKKNGQIVSPGHDKHIQPTIDFLDSIGCPPKMVGQITPLVQEHMVHMSMSKPTKRAVRRLSLRLERATIQELGMLVKADQSGRPPLPGKMPVKMQAILDMAEEMALSKESIKPILMGRHLIDLGMKPGKEFGVILDKAFEAQVDGIFDNLEDGLVWLKDSIQ